jgi:hypothetical protein
MNGGRVKANDRQRKSALRRKTFQRPRQVSKTICLMHDIVGPHFLRGSCKSSVVVVSARYRSSGNGAGNPLPDGEEMERFRRQLTVGGLQPFATTSKWAVNHFFWLLGGGASRFGRLVQAVTRQPTMLPV